VIKRRIINMGKITVSKCGARFVHHADKNFSNKKGVIRILTDEEEKDIFSKYPEKKTVKKKVYKEEQQELENMGTELPVDIEDENLDGVSV
jgi:hypothetical protein